MRLLTLFILICFANCSRNSNMLTVLLNPKKLDQHLDPVSIPYTNDFHLLENLVTRLVSFDEKGNYQFELASSIKPLNELEYIITIKETFFSNGEKIIANDVKETFDRVLRKGASHVNLRELVHSIAVLNDTTLKIILKKKSKSFFYYLSLPDLGILHKSQYVKESLLAEDFVLVSSGPFSYGFKEGEYFLVKNKHYLLTPLDYPDKVKLLNYFSKDANKLILNNEADVGKVSVSFYLKNLEDFKKNKDLKMIGVPSGSLSYLFFNENSGNFKNSHHRLWFKKLVTELFKLPEEYTWLSRRSYQYFPPESKAFLSPEEVQEVIKDYISIKPKDFPRKLKIHTFTTTYNVIPEKLVTSLRDQLAGHVELEIITDVDPDDFDRRFKEGSFDVFLNIMSTDFRTPVEAINFEYFSGESVLKDKNNFVRDNYLLYQSSTNEADELKFLKNISKEMLRSDQVIPLFHSATPYVYDSTKVDFGRLSHIFIYNFWKLKVL